MLAYQRYRHPENALADDEDEDGDVELIDAPNGIPQLPNIHEFFPGASSQPYDFDTISFKVDQLSRRVLGIAAFGQVDERKMQVAMN